MGQKDIVAKYSPVGGSSLWNVLNFAGFACTPISYENHSMISSSREWISSPKCRGNKGVGLRKVWLYGIVNLIVLC